MRSQQSLDTDKLCFCSFVASEAACTMKTETCFELERRKDATRKLTKIKRHFLKRPPFLESRTRYFLHTGKSNLSACLTVSLNKGRNCGNKAVILEIVFENKI